MLKTVETQYVAGADSSGDEISVDIISGFNAKAPAAILLQARGRRLLLDAGGALQPGQPSGWTVPDNLDAVLISHDHVDHIGALSQLSGQVPVYATAPVAASLPSHLCIRELPLRGRTDICGISVSCGQAGHSLGGIWLHFELADGLFYSGDFSCESQLFPFDLPPPAKTALLDASYGLYNLSLQAGQQALAARLHERLLLPVPPTGRAAEMALWLEQRIPGLWCMDEPCREALARLLQMPPEGLKADARAALARLQCREFSEQVPVIIAADPDGIGGEAGRIIGSHKHDRQVIYSGYMPPRAAADVAAGRAQWLRWNVHPRRDDLVWLAGHLQAQKVMPLFCCLKPLHEWQRLLGERLLTETRFGP